MPGNYADTSAIIDGETIDAADIKNPIDALDDVLKAVVTASFIVASSSATLTNETTLAAALANPPAIGDTTPAMGTFSDIRVSGAAAASRPLSFRTAGSARWIIQADNTAESGSNVGSDLRISRFSDAGSFLAHALTITRSSGAVAVTGALSKGSGSFLIDHPLDPDNKSLGHGFVEAPRYDLIYRGRAKLVAGAAAVSIDEASNMTPGTWAALCKNAQVFVSNNEGWTAVRGSMDESTGLLSIEAQDAACADTVDWLVVAERDDPYVYGDPFTDENGQYVPEHDKPAAGDDNLIGQPQRGERRHPLAEARKLEAKVETALKSVEQR